MSPSMEVQAKNTSEEISTPDPKPGLGGEDPNYYKTLDTHDSQRLFEYFDSNCSTPYVSAPSSPGRGGPVSVGGFFYSCPASPMHFAITKTAALLSQPWSGDYGFGGGSVPLGGYEFEFSARSGSAGSGQSGSMSSADELFLNGQIRPMKLSTHLERPQVLAPLLDLENEEEVCDQDDIETKNGSRMGNKNSSNGSRGRDLRLRDKSLRRRTRYMSPLRSASFEFVHDEDKDGKNLGNMESCGGSLEAKDESVKIEEGEEATASTPSVSASSSRSSSAGRNSKRWVFLKDFLYRSKSEGRSTNKFWSNIPFSPAKDKKSINNTATATPRVQVQAVAVSKEKGNGNVSSTTLAVENQKGKRSGQAGSGKNPVNGVGKRRVPTSPHELHYKASRAQAEEMRKKTLLPYRQGLLGCLGFSSKGYGTMNVFARTLNPVSSR